MKGSCDIEVQNCLNYSGRVLYEMDPKVAILKVLKPYLLQNGQSDSAETW